MITNGDFVRNLADLKEIWASCRTVNSVVRLFGTFGHFSAVAHALYLNVFSSYFSRMIGSTSWLILWAPTELTRLFDIPVNFLEHFRSPITDDFSRSSRNRIFQGRNESVFSTEEIARVGLCIRYNFENVFKALSFMNIFLSFGNIFEHFVLKLHLQRRHFCLD